MVSLRKLSSKIRTNSISRLLFLISFIFVFNSCLNTNKRTSNTTSNGNNAENEIINQIVLPLLDSVKATIQLNLNKDIKNLPCIFYGDSLHYPFFDYQEAKSIFQDEKLKIDSLFLAEEPNTELILDNKSLNGINTFHKISIRNEVQKISEENLNKFLLLSFSRLYFNKTKTESCFNFNLIVSEYSGRPYIVLAEKKDNKWKIKRILIYAIV